MSYGLPLPGSVRIPVAGSSGGFGFRRSATHHHQGVDLVAPVGTPWLAIGDGVIEHVSIVPTRRWAGYGRIVVVRLDSGERVLYAHGRIVTVVVGAHVRRGDKLGEVGRSRWLKFPEGHPRAGEPDPSDEGRMGAHLHLEIAHHAYPMDSEAPYRIDPAVWFRERYNPSEPLAVSKSFSISSSPVWVLVGVTTLAGAALGAILFFGRR